MTPPDVTAPAPAVVYVLSAVAAGPGHPGDLVVQLYRSDPARPDYTERIGWAMMSGALYGYVRQLLPEVLATVPRVSVAYVGIGPEGASPVPGALLKALRLALAVVRRARA